MEITFRKKQIKGRVSGAWWIAVHLLHSGKSIHLVTYKYFSTNFHANVAESPTLLA